MEDLAAEAFIYGYPLVEQLRPVFAAAHGEGPLGGPVNTVRHLRTVFDARLARDFGVVSPNNDTIYSIATVDVGPEPLVLRVPEVGDRYYVLQFIDVWTNNFAYVGTRSVGEQAGEFLLVAPGWGRDGPDGVRIIHAPTRLFTIGGRFLVNGAADIANVAQLQDALALIPLSRYPELPDLTARVAGDWPLPQPDPQVPGDLAFWEKLRTFTRAYPPHGDDVAYQQRFEPLGLLAEQSPYVRADPALRAALQTGENEARERIEAQSQHAFPLRNNWQAVRELFNYNAHFFEFGTIDDPDWTIADPQRGRLVRALAARIGIDGNHAYEAFYPLTFLDADGEQLTGQCRYLLHFEQTRPVDGFWSLTMYDVPRFCSSTTRSTGTRSEIARKVSVATPTDHWTSTSNSTPPNRAVRRIGSRHLPASSDRSCGCTTPAPRPSTTPSGTSPQSRKRSDLRVTRANPQAALRAPAQ